MILEHTNKGMAYSLLLRKETKRKALLTCDLNLLTCNRELVTCDPNLLTCDRNLLTCDRDLLAIPT